MAKLTRITVLISGNGSNLQALIDDKDQKLTTSRIIHVVSNRKDAYGLARAKKSDIPTSYHNLVAYKKKHPDNIDKARQAYDEDLAKMVLEGEPDLVVCAGFMHILSPQFLEPLEKKGVAIINLHPALRGEYNGANAIERAHADFMSGKITQTGVMIHYVISEVDMGEPIVQIPIALSHPEDDELEVLQNRIHEIEHGAIVEGTRIAVERIQKSPN